MFRGFLILAAVLAATCVFGAEADVDEPDRVARPTPVDSMTATEKASEQFFARGSLSLRQRRDLGLTIPNIANALRDLQKDGLLEKDMDRSVVAALVLERLAAQNPKSYAAPELDIDAIIAFIEAILPLIMMIIQLFSYAAPAGAVAAVACIA